jgi:hypothetical protein
VIPDLLPDDYWLTVKAPAGFYVKSATIKDGDVLRSPLRAGAGELRIVLGQDGPVLTVQTGDSENHPVPGASMILGRHPLPPSPAPDDLVLLVSDQNGRAVFKGVAPGEYRLLVFANALVDRTGAEELFLANRSKGEAITLAPRESHSVQVKALDLPPRTGG